MQYEMAILVIYESNELNLFKASRILNKLCLFLRKIIALKIHFRQTQYFWEKPIRERIAVPEIYNSLNFSNFFIFLFSFLFSILSFVFLKKEIFFTIPRHILPLRVFFFCILNGLFLLNILIVFCSRYLYK